jgi:hypothetical protein
LRTKVLRKYSVIENQKRCFDKPHIQKIREWKNEDDLPLEIPTGKYSQIHIPFTQSGKFQLKAVVVSHYKTHDLFSHQNKLAVNNSGGSTKAAAIK